MIKINRIFKCLKKNKQRFIFFIVKNLIKEVFFGNTIFKGGIFLSIHVADTMG